MTALINNAAASGITRVQRPLIKATLATRPRVAFTFIQARHRLSETYVFYQNFLLITALTTYIMYSLWSGAKE
jgi:hypothetical protein